MSEKSSIWLQEKKTILLHSIIIILGLLGFLIVLTGSRIGQLGFWRSRVWPWIADVSLTVLLLVCVFLLAVLELAKHLLLFIPGSICLICLFFYFRFGVNRLDSPIALKERI